MKQEAINKINTMGKVGHIMVIICRIFIIIGFVGLIAGIVAMAILPKDLVVATFKGEATVDINLEDFKVGFKEFDIKFSEEQQNQIKDELLNDDDIDMEVNGKELGVTDVEVTESSINFSAKTNNIVFKISDLWYIIVLAALKLIAIFVILVFIDKLCVAIKNCKSPFEEKVIKSLEHFAFSLIGWSIANSLIDCFVNAVLTGTLDFMISVDFGMLTLVLIVLAISYIFKYGAVLQQESDETL